MVDSILFVPFWRWFDIFCKSIYLDSFLENRQNIFQYNILFYRSFRDLFVKSYFINNGFQGNTYSSVSVALDAAKAKAASKDLIYVGGSTFVVAEIV